MRSQSRSIPVSTLFFALLGLIWCGYVAFPTATPAPCATSGCTLFRDAKFAGLSLWWVGGAYFFLLAILCLRGSRHLARHLALLALFLDSILLVIMFLTAPCFDCLVVAAIMGCCYFTVRHASSSADGWFTSEELRPSVLLPIWFGLFLGNAVLAANEQLPLYSVGNKTSNEISVYFSPSCPACREALLSVGASAALYPVDEGPGDVDSIIIFISLLEAKVPIAQALERSLDPKEEVPDLSLLERAQLGMRLLRNKASLLRHGFRSLPLIQINGMPGHKPTAMDGSTRPRRAQSAPAAAPQAPYSDPQTGSYLPPDVSAPISRHDAPPPSRGVSGGDMLPEFLQAPGELRRCGGDTAEPCDER